jgi:hypothetical protein
VSKLQQLHIPALLEDVSGLLGHSSTVERLSLEQEVGGSNPSVSACGGSLAMGYLSFVYDETRLRAISHAPFIRRITGI